MLRTLRIRDLVIVDDLRLEFGPGLNVLTGETGAGKSILVDAMGLVVGARADRALIRSGAERAVVEALFHLDDDAPARTVAAELGIDALEDGELVIRREVSSQGGGRVLVNGSPCTVAMLRELGGALLELHGQHDQQSLLDVERHLELLDRFADAGAALEKVAVAHQRLREGQRARADLEELAADRAEAEDRLRRIVEEIDAVDPKPGELAELDRERSLLLNGARMVELLDRAVDATTAGDPSAAVLAARAARATEELAAIDPTLEELARRLDAAAIELADAGEALSDYRARQDFNPDRQEIVEQRRAAIDRLLLHHGEDEAAVRRTRDEAAARLESLGDLEQQLAAADQQRQQDEKAYIQAARTLRRRRKAAVPRIVAAIQGELAELALAQAQLEVELADGRGDRVGDWPVGARGADRAELQLAANPGEPPRPLRKAASGGELSRIMLALHAVFEEGAGQRVIVFDEVDTGVGGAVADAIGRRLGSLAGSHQVLCITHLPQVAAYGQTHFRVSKEVAEGRTRAGVERLEQDGQVDELARMLSGRRPGPTSRKHATELIRSAQRGVRQTESCR